MFQSAIALPDPAEMLVRSAWVPEIPGLPEAVQRWFVFAPPRRAYLEQRARVLAKPAWHLGGLLHLTGTAGRALGAATVWATADRIRSSGQGGNARVRDATRRAEQVVRSGGPAFVKLGQFISTARGILPQEVVEAFEWCRDEVAPLPAATACAAIEQALGRRVDEAFADFDRAPAAAASIAQVHRARLHDGRSVAVKVRRPGLYRQFEVSIRAMAVLAAMSERWSVLARSANARGFVELFAQCVLEELDFRLEALNMVEVGLAAEHAGIGFVRCPRPIPDMVTENVLVMEWLPGVRYTDAAALLHSGVDPGRLLRLAIQTILEHTLVYGRFHGDLHAGNVLVTPEGDFSLIDFGILGRLDAGQRAALVRLVAGFATDNIDSQLLALVEFGAIPEASVPMLRAAFEREPRLRQRGGLTHDKLADEVSRMMRVVVSSGFRMPKTLVLFFKNLLYLNGFAAAIAPGRDLLAEIEPIFKYFQGKYADEMATITGVAGRPS